VTADRRLSRRGLVAGGVAAAAGLAVVGRVVTSGDDRRRDGGGTRDDDGPPSDPADAPLLVPGRLRKAIGLAPFVGLGVEQGRGDFDPDRGRFVRGGRLAGNVQLACNLQAWGNLPAGDDPGLFLDTGTGIVRIWAPWDEIMAPGPGRFDGRTLQAIDANVRAANALRPRPLRVVLVTSRHPGWVTGCAARDADGTYRPIDVDDTRERYVRRFDPSRRDAAGDAWDALRRGWRLAGQSGTGRHPVHRWPGSVGDPTVDGLEHVRPGGAWYRWIEFLARRYHPDPDRRATVHFPDAPDNVDGAFVDLLEVMNEPNFECWPQFVTVRDGRAVVPSADDADDERIAVGPRMTAEMLRSANAICADVNDGARRPLLFGGPATSDSFRPDESSSAVMGYDRFLLRLVALLGGGFAADARFVWTHHAYKDVERRRTDCGGPGPATISTSSTDWVVRLLRHRTVDGRLRGEGPSGWRGWTGWPSGRPDDACVALTEGGCRRNRDVPTRAAQTRRLRDAFVRLRDGELRDAVVLFTTFLAWQDESVDNSGYLLSRTRDGRDLGRSRIPRPRDLTRQRTPLYATWRRLREG